MEFAILILDDEKYVCNSLKRILETPDRKIFLSTHLEKAQDILKENYIDLVLLDYKLDNIDGLTILKQIKEEYPEILIIMITAYGNIDIAVEAMKAGAYDFIQKKEDPDFIRYNVKRALENLKLKKEVEDLRNSFRREAKIPEIITVSPKIKKLLKLAEEYAKSDTTVLLTGETGTGKNLFGEYIHMKSMRFNKPFIQLNCAAIPHELLESELFGYEKGAFTGAHQKGKKGLIEMAHNGTLLLDEISELSLEMQSKILHVLERNEFFRIGGTNPSLADVRFIAVSNAILQDRVDRKQFRLDLFYRLNVATIDIPPLRERKEDILHLVKYFIVDFNYKFKKSVTKISPEAEQFLLNAPWPGNIRELRNVIERAMLLKKNEGIEVEDFMRPMAGDALKDDTSVDGQLFTLRINSKENVNLIHYAQKQLINQALQKNKHNRSQTAQMLGIPRTTLNFYIKKFNLL